MATLKQIKGSAIQFLDADPVVYAGSWSSGGSVNTARQYGAGIGSSTAGLIFGGSSPPVVANTEQYNGTAWTEVNDLNAAQNAQASAGTLTSGMSALGAQSPGANVEDWNGTSWSANPHSLNSARQFPGGDGASNDSALMVGGEPAPNGALTEIYNGSSWTESGDLNTARNQLAAAGTVTALIAMGGNTGADAETFNGSAWTAVTDMNSGSGGISGSGTSTLALAFAGDPDVANTESWNGSAWTEVNDLSTGREFGASSNITGNTTAFLASGHTTTLVSNTEEWTTTPAADFTQINLGQVYYNSGSNAFKVTEQPVPGGTWSSGGSLNTGRYNLGSAGISNTSALAFGGASPSRVANTESYDGTSWTEVNDMGSAKNEIAGFGTQTSAILAGGTTAGPAETGAQSWDGTNWTNISSLNTAAVNMGSFGASNSSGLKATGNAPGSGNVSATETWNGSSWTEVAEVNTTRYLVASFGVQTSGAIVGGNPGFTTSVESWNGTSWTEIAENNTGRFFGSAIGSGTLTSALVYGGEEPPSTSSARTEFYNGTSWTELNDLSQASSYLGGRATGATSSIAFGGLTTAPLSTTEEWTVDVTNETITVS